MSIMKKPASGEDVLSNLCGRGPRPLILALLLGLLTLLAPTAALAANPPQITSTAVSEVTETSATISATIDPTGGATTAHLQYTTLEAFEAEGFEGAIRIPLEESEDFSIPAGAPQAISAPLAGLDPASGYVFGVFAKKAASKPAEAQSTFYTFGPSPLFGSCPNDEYRSGERAAPGAPGALLPDCRSYEQATPVDKNGDDATGPSQGPIYAAADGSGVFYGSMFGIPGGTGAQILPFYQGFRSGEEWSSMGLLPPADLGELARSPIGELPDFSSIYGEAGRFGSPRVKALFELHRDGSPPTQITPYTFTEAKGERFYGFAGASADASSVVIEASTALSEVQGGPPIPGSAADVPNVYAWDRETDQLHLASAMNTSEETEEKLPKGAYAGTYTTVYGQSPLLEGGPSQGNYTVDLHAVSENGSVFFTSRSDGHIYERVNPTRPQSAMETVGGEEVCSEPTKACTLDVSASKRSEPDPGGPQPAAFQGASADGSKVFFTSSQKLTDDANTGPEQPPAQIGRATLNGDEPAGSVKEKFLLAHAVGVAVDPKGEYIYWVDPTSGTISRAGLDGSGDLVPNSVEAEFIVPGKTLAETHQVTEHGVKTLVPSTPRYVAVGPCAGGGECVYWTNTGPAGESTFGEIRASIDGQGTIGRAKLDGSGGLVPGSVKPEFITGASNPQGIAVNSKHVYWANTANAKERRAIGWAAIDGSAVEQDFVIAGEFPVYGVALSATHLYFEHNDESDNFSAIHRVPLEGGKVEGSFVGEAGLRGIALDAGHVYWATQGEGGAIGRANLELEHVEKHFLTPAGKVEGLASDGPHLFWSVNAEAPGNPGNDLYRFEPSSRSLSDLTPGSSNEAENGAQVRGVLGTSADGSYVYFAANADLDGPGGEAEAGNCTGRRFDRADGECNIYLYHDGEYKFVARVAMSRFFDSDAVNWLTKVESVFLTGSVTPKSSIVSADGHTLVFRSTQALTPYDNEGEPELYRYHLGEGVSCVSCTPTGGSPAEAHYFSDQNLPNISPSRIGFGELQPRFASADGDRVFFATIAALVSYDTDGNADVYEWEAPGKGTCSQGGPGYSPLNQGCIYLISQGSEDEPAFLAGASESGDDVFFFTRSSLVGQDGDGLVDAYDARVGGGLTSQNPISTPPCEAEGCKPEPTSPPDVQSPQQFSGPPNPEPPKACPKGRVRKHGRCVAKKGKNHHKKKAGHRKGGAK